VQEHEVSVLVQHGVKALRQGNTAEAIAAFSKVVDAGRGDASLLMALAAAYRRERRLEPALEKAAHALRMEPANLQAVLLNADLLADSGQTRGAAAYYLAALKLASTLESIPEAVQPDLARGQAFCNEQTSLTEHSVRVALAAEPASMASARFCESLDIMFGRTKPYLQQPKHYFFPDLPHTAFFDPNQFDWVAELEQHTDAIREEVLALLATPDQFKPYVERNFRSPQFGVNRMVNNPEWSAFYLWKHGELIEQNAARCPRTVAAIGRVPLTQMPARSPSVLFSIMKPNAHIPPHHGMINTRLIAHLPLIVPNGCEFRVGNHTRRWQEGKVWIFDDTIEHEAWNRSDQTRAILLFEVWRPELSNAERDGVNSLFAAIDAHTGQAPAWEI